MRAKFKKKIDLSAVYVKLCAEATRHIQIIRSEKEWRAYIARFGGWGKEFIDRYPESRLPSRYPLVVTTHSEPDGNSDCQVHTCYYEDGSVARKYT